MPTYPPLPSEDADLGSISDISITRCSPETWSSRAAETKYELLVTACDEISEEKWTVWRRHQEFCSLRTKIVEAFGADYAHLRYTPFPSADLLGRPQQIERRRALLEMWLVTLAATPGVCDSKDFIQFLSNDVNIYPLAPFEEDTTTPATKIICATEPLLQDQHRLADGAQGVELVQYHDSCDGLRDQVPANHNHDTPCSAGCELELKLELELELDCSELDGATFDLMFPRPPSPPPIIRRSHCPTSEVFSDCSCAAVTEREEEKEEEDPDELSVMGVEQRQQLRSAVFGTSTDDIAWMFIGEARHPGKATGTTWSIADFVWWGCLAVIAAAAVTCCIHLRWLFAGQVAQPHLALGPPKPILERVEVTVSTHETVRQSDIVTESPGLMTAHGCRCLAETIDFVSGVRFNSCGIEGWCDVEPGCAAAKEANINTGGDNNPPHEPAAAMTTHSDDYGGWDECVSRSAEPNRPLGKLNAGEMEENHQGVWDKVFTMVKRGGLGLTALSLSGVVSVAAAVGGQI
eukprot:SAG22_NODE_274_length_13178_cov_17.793715_11_plen_520_part_00